MALVCKKCGYKQYDEETIKAYKEVSPTMEEHDIPYICGACGEQHLEEAIKKNIEKVLRQMCLGKSREWSETMVNRIYDTNVIYVNCIEDCVCIDEDMIVSALMEVIIKDYEYWED
jgi:hypothetical protein